MAKKVGSEIDKVELHEGTFSRTEHFFEQNKKTVTFAIIGLLLVVGIYFAYKKVYVASLDKDAAEKMYMAESMFERDSFNLALNGVGNTPGFLAIIDEYGATKSANLAEYYAGISYLNLGNFDKAIEYLSDFDGGSTQTGALAIGCIGDAYYEKGDTDKAVSYYKDAISSDDAMVAPMYLKKMALVYEKQGKLSEAVEAFETIKEKYKKSSIAATADKYIARLNAQIK